jgi:mono/diheme cytochrome c family protein
LLEASLSIRTMAIAALALAGAAAQAQVAVPTGRLLASNCFQCHGTDGKGPGLTATFPYDAASGTMVSVPEAGGASSGWSAGLYRDMDTWFNALTADSFA